MPVDKAQKKLALQECAREVAFGDAEKELTLREFEQVVTSTLSHLHVPFVPRDLGAMVELTIHCDDVETERLIVASRSPDAPGSPGVSYEQIVFFPEDRKRCQQFLTICWHIDNALETAVRKKRGKTATKAKRGKSSPQSDTIGKLKDLCKLRDKEQRAGRVQVVWTVACNRVGIDPKTAKKYAPELRRHWDDLKHPTTSLWSDKDNREDRED
ncbi:MAG: hypothetical protein FJ026_13640 [Chloroflexi bacterium]|nr:hypothetical protein [Chloroflexota bacterium]